MALSSQNSLYTWGAGEGGRLGLGDKGNHNSPRLVSFLGDINITLISAGASHSVAVSENGEVYTWGDGAFGKLGHGNEQAQTFPKLVAGLKGITITSISAGGKHTTAASEKGEIYVWGSDDAGQLGLGYSKTNQLAPKALPSMRGIKIVQLSSGAQRSAALTDKGEVFTWGRGDHGRLGHGDTASQPYPKSVAALRGIPIICISSGGGHNAVLSVSGEVYCWGRGDSGQLGIGSKTHQMVPKLVQYLQGIRIIDISAGGYHTVAISDSGEMYTWGRGDYGVLGSGDEQNQLLPKLVPIGTEKMMRASAGFWHNLAINDAHELFSWGNGEGGKLGQGSETSRNSPQRVESFRNMKVEHLSAGETHSIALAHEYRVTKATTPFRPVLPQNYHAKGSASPMPLHTSFPPLSTSPLRSANLTSSANAATSPRNLTSTPVATSPPATPTTPPPRQAFPISNNNNVSSDTPHYAPERARSFKAPQRRETPVPEDIALSFQSYTEWFTCMKRLRDFVTVLENYSANATGTTTPAAARRAAATKDKEHYSHFVDVDKAIKNYDTANTDIKAEVEVLSKQRQPAYDKLDKLVALRDQVAASLKADLQTTLTSWEAQIVGKFSTSIETLSAELLSIGCPQSALEETGISVTALGCISFFANVQDQIKSYTDELKEMLTSVVTGTMDELNFQRLQRVALSMASNIIECGKQYLALARDQKQLALSITSTYQSRLADLENLQPSIVTGNELLKQREKLKAELRTCRHTIIEHSRKIELLVLDEAEDHVIQSAQAHLKTFRSEEQIILSKQQENEAALLEIISQYAPELQVRMNKISLISNKIRDTGLVVDDRRFEHYEKVKTLATAPHNVFLMLYAGQEVVLKEFSVGDEASRKMFETQVSLMKRLGNHPVILPIDSVFFDRNAYIQMKYISGGNLRQWLIGKTALDGAKEGSGIKRKPWEIQRVIHQISQGIAYMHSCSIIHRDLKLENILMKGSQHPLITDFDLSKDTSFDTFASSSKTSFVAGTEEYLAPEVREGRSTGTAGSDMWAFGIILYKAHFPAGPIPVLLPGQKSVIIPNHENERLRSLLISLLQRDPVMRPSAHQVCVHPYFTTSLVEDMVSSKQLVDSDKKIAAFRAHLTSLTEFFDNALEDHTLSVAVRRAHLVDDVLRGLKDMSKDSLYWRLEVEFVGEKGIDYGGLSSEMFSLFFNHGTFLDSAVNSSVFSPISGMFEKSSTESYFYLPVSNTCANKKAQNAFVTVGKIFLKMAVDGRPLPDAFAPSFFKFLLGIPPNLQDLEAYDSALALSFRKLLVLDRVEDFLSETFEGLVPGGDTILLTDANKEEYVQKSIEKYLVTDRIDQLESIRKGFLGIESLNAHFNLFSPTELALFLCGNSHINAESIKQNLKFKFFPKKSKTPEYLQAVLDGLSQDNLRRFLRYITGMVAIPLEGMGKPIIVQYQPASDHLPSAHTCSFQLDLPDYDAMDITKTKILKMLEWLDAGFAFV